MCARHLSLPVATDTMEYYENNNALEVYDSILMSRRFMSASRAAPTVRERNIGSTCDLLRCRDWHSADGRKVYHNEHKKKNG